MWLIGFVIAFTAPLMVFYREKHKGLLVKISIKIVLLLGELWSGIAQLPKLHYHITENIWTRGLR